MRARIQGLAWSLKTRRLVRDLRKSLKHLSTETVTAELGTLETPPLRFRDRVQATATELGRIEQRLAAFNGGSPCEEDKDAFSNYHLRCLIDELRANLRALYDMETSGDHLIK